MEIMALVSPSVNRVYGKDAPRLAKAELAFVLERSAPGALTGTALVQEAGVTYLRLSIADAAWESPETSLAIVRALAFSPHVFAAFEEVGRMPLLEASETAREASAEAADPTGEDSSPTVGEGERVYVDELPSVPLLQPLPLPRVEQLPSDLLTTLKYQGKTNEQFTALLLVLAAAAAGRTAQLADGTLRVLDPVAGRGTTLNQALAWGLSPVGVDLDVKDAGLYRAFLTTWLKQHRFKHRVDSGKLTVHRRALGARFTAEFARSKEEQKAGRVQRVELFTADTAELGTFLKASSADVIVADLPYGVQHGSRAGKHLQRSPLDLLAAALPAWRQVLAPGGALALAINRHTAPPDEVRRVLDEHGFEALETDERFRHRVDASIDRDVVLARR